MMNNNTTLPVTNYDHITNDAQMILDQYTAQIANMRGSLLLLGPHHKTTEARTIKYHTLIDQYLDLCTHFNFTTNINRALIKTKILHREPPTTTTIVYFTFRPQDDNNVHIHGPFITKPVSLKTRNRFVLEYNRDNIIDKYYNWQ